MTDKLTPDEVRKLNSMARPNHWGWWSNHNGCIICGICDLVITDLNNKESYYNKIIVHGRKHLNLISFI
jgi:hypothetical protein